MTTRKSSSQSPVTVKEFKSRSKTGYSQALSNPLLSQAEVKGKEHAQVILNLGELATIGIGALVTAEVNHTRSAQTVWTWRVVEMLASLPVLAYSGHKDTLGRLALGVFIGAAVEGLVDSTPGLTGWDVLPPEDSRITYHATR